MNTLAGKVALVTGGSSGIGLASARIFAEEGAQVIITGRHLSSVRDAIDVIGSNAVGFVGDVADITHHDHVANEIRSRFGGIDIYMANAGTNVINHSSQVSEEEYESQFSVNTKGVFFGVQRMAPIIRNGGSIVITGSIASDRFMPGHAVYAGSKAAIFAFVRSWAIELKSRNIRVNVLSPGPVDTPILNKLGIPLEERAKFEQQVIEAIPLGRLGLPEELGSAALFLASDASSFITGIGLCVDGGMSLL